MKSAKVLAIALAVIIIALLGVLLFVSPAKSPTINGQLRVSTPRENDLITSPLTATGTVTGGGWFFEASFPIKVLDGDGTVLGQHPAQAQSDWMTTGTVPFVATVSFSAPKYATGTIVFEKDNPSGLPQNAGELRIPVRFTSAN